MPLKIKSLSFVFLGVLMLLGCTRGLTCLPYQPSWEITAAQPEKMGKVSAYGEIKIVKHNRVFVFQAVVVFQGPECMRMEILSPLGPPEAMLSIAHGRFRLLFPARRELYEDPEKLSLLFPFSIPIRDLPPLIYGAMPLREEGDCLLSIKDEGEEVFSHFSKSKWEIVVWMDKKSRQIKRTVFHEKNGEAEIMVLYGERINLGSLSFPRKVEIISENIKVLFEFDSIELIAGGESLELPERP